MNESSFSKYLCQKFKENGMFHQRLEVTTGAGVPDIAVMSDKGIFWVELKWKTRHIRPEQYIWGVKAGIVGVTVNYLVGYEDTIELYTVTDAEPMSKSFKLTDLVTTVPRTKDGIVELLPHMK